MTKSQAIQHFGSISALAKALGVTYEAVRQWADVPELRQYQIERLTKGALKAGTNAAARPCRNSPLSGLAPVVAPSSCSGIQ